MKRLVALSIACLTVGLAVPALAQPLDIFVRGGHRVVLPSSAWSGNDYYMFGWPNDPRNGDNFDPAAAAMNATNAAFPRRGRNFPVNIGLAGELGYRQGSWMGHIEACQARYVTYDLVTDTILVNGLPRRCPY
jgi:hypothetical protein